MSSIQNLLVLICIAVVTITCVTSEVTLQPELSNVINSTNPSNVETTAASATTTIPIIPKKRNSRAKTLYEELNCTLSEPGILNCDNRNLKKIPNFSKMANITKISYRNNSIENVDLYLFPADLLSLDLSNNKIQQITAGTNTKIKDSLEELYLDRNQIELKGPLIPSDLKKLTKLTLSYNPITKIPTNAFNTLKKLEVIDLSNCKINTINEMVLTELKSLRVLNLTNNNLFNNQLDDKLFVANKNLTELNLSKNNFIEVPYAIRSTNSIETLRLNGNQIASLRRSDFINQANIRYLEIKNNSKLKKIDEFAFSEMPNLKTLIISDNPNLSCISMDSFKQATNSSIELEYLDISNNKLTNLMDPRNFTSLKVTSMKLDGNQWICDCSLRWLNVLAKEQNLAPIHCKNEDRFKHIEISQFFQMTDCDAQESQYHTLIVTGFFLFLLGISVAVFIQKSDILRRLQWRDQYGTIYYTKASFPPETV